MENVSDTLSRMPPEEVELLLIELQAWCKEKHGRQRELADAIGVSEQVVSNWLYRRKNPSLPYWLKLVAFAKKQRRAKPRT